MAPRQGVYVLPVCLVLLVSTVAAVAVAASLRVPHVWESTVISAVNNSSAYRNVRILNVSPFVLKNVILDNTYISLVSENELSLYCKQFKRFCIHKSTMYIIEITVTSKNVQWIWNHVVRITTFSGFLNQQACGFLEEYVYVFTQSRIYDVLIVNFFTVILWTSQTHLSSFNVVHIAKSENNSIS